MTQTFDLNKMGLAQMSEFEMQEIDGGDYATGYVVGHVVGQILAGSLVVYGAYALFFL